MLRPAHLYHSRVGTFFFRPYRPYSTPRLLRPLCSTHLYHSRVGTFFFIPYFSLPQSPYLTPSTVVCVCLGFGGGGCQTHI